MMKGFRLTFSLLMAVWISPATAVELPISARAAIVVDSESGEVLFQRSADLALPPASTTKILTAIVAIESGQLDETLEVSSYAASIPPTKVGLPVGSRARLQDLLYAVLLKSANDASEVVAEGLSGSEAEFAGRMNAKARRIGATNSHFENPHGLTAEGHVSTARDLARIFRYGLNLPMFRDILSTREFDFAVEADAVRMVTVRSHNRLLNGYSYPVIGKTGFTRAARRCFVGAATADNREVVIAILGSRDLWGDARKLIEFGIEGRTIFDDDLPVVMAGRDRDADNEVEDDPPAFAYDRLARAHLRAVPVERVRPPAPVRAPTPPRLMAAAVAIPRPDRFVRRWITTKFNGRTVRTLVAEPTVPAAREPRPATRQGTRTTQVAARQPTGALLLRDVSPGKRNDGRVPAPAIARGAARPPVQPVVAFKSTVKIPVGKIALARTPVQASAKKPAKALVEPPRGKLPAATPAARGASSRTPPAAPAKLKVSGSRPAVVVRR
jgi:D-alanyl-D-alanine carboxypeptidase